MHLPDGFLSPPVAGAAMVATLGSVGVAVRQLAREDPADAPSPALTGVVSAFIFCAQMFNFPVSGATTGHLLGAALATALLGPWRAVIVMAVVLFIQTFVFGDGGVVAAGANVFNMGVAGSLISALILPAVIRLKSESPTMRTAGLALAAWASVMLAALLTALQLAASGTVPARVVVPAMLGVHAIIGVGEAILSVTAFGLIAARRPGATTIAASAPGVEPWRLAAVLALGLIVVRLAFPHPDGLEFVAEQQGFAGAAAESFAAAPLPDYTVPGHAADTGFDWFGSYASAAVGIVLCGGLMFGVGVLPGRRRRD